MVDSICASTVAQALKQSDWQHQVQVFVACVFLQAWVLESDGMFSALYIKVSDS